MIKNLWESFCTYLLQTLYAMGHRQRLNWFYYTIIFGSLPIVFRFIASLSSEHIPLFSLADFAFWGIMLNTAAIANITNQKNTSTDLIVGTVMTALTHIVVFVAIYCLALFPDIYQAILWVFGSIALASSLLLSYSTTDNDFMLRTQVTLEAANAKEEMHPLMREYIEEIEKRIMDGKNPNESEGIIDYFDSIGYECDREKMEFRPKKNAKRWRVVDDPTE